MTEVKQKRVLNVIDVNFLHLQDGDQVRDKSFILALLATRLAAVQYRGRPHLSDLTITG